MSTTLTRAQAIDGWEFLQETFILSGITVASFACIAYAYDFISMRAPKKPTLSTSTKPSLLLLIKHSLVSEVGTLKLYILQTLLSTLTCVIFVYRIETFEMNVFLRLSSLAFHVFFVFHLIVRIYIFPSTKLKAVLDTYTILDIISITSGLYSIYTKNWLSLTFLRAILLSEAYSIASNILRNRTNWSSVNIHLTGLCLQSVVLIFTFASIIFVSENLGDIPGLPDYRGTGSGEWGFFTCVYFVLVTLSTVGYGDISATTVIGRTSALIFVFSGIILIGSFTTKLVELTTASAKGRGRLTLKKSDRFLLVCGNPSFASVQDLLEDLFHEDNLTGTVDDLNKVVILSQCVAEPDFYEALKQFTYFNTHYRDKVEILFGTPLNQTDLLLRAKANSADACFVLSDSAAKDDEEDDTSNILRALAIRKNCPALSDHVFLLMKNMEFSSLIPSLNFPPQNCVYQEMTRLQTMALSCLCPGFSTIFYNLAKSRGFNIDSKVNAMEWEREYLAGASKELYVVQMREELFSPEHTFGEISTVIAEKNQMLLGVSVCGKVYLNPAKYTLGQIRAHAKATVLKKEESKRLSRMQSGKSKADIDALSGDVKVDDVMLGLFIAEDGSETRAFGDRQREHHGNTASDPGFFSTLNAIIEEENKATSEHTDATPMQYVQRYDVNVAAEMNGILLPESIDSPVISPWKPEEAAVLSGHIVLICSDSESVPIFIRTFREQELSVYHSLSRAGMLDTEQYPSAETFLKHIVILCETPVEAKHFRESEPSHMKKVLFKEGSPLSAVVLRSVRVHKAGRIVVLGASSRKIIENEREAGLVDAGNIFILLRIKDFISNEIDGTGEFVLSDLQHEDNVMYFQDQGETTMESDELWVSRMFASGEIYSNRFSYLMIGSSFFNKNMMLFFNQLISPDRSDHTQVGGAVFSIPMSRVKRRERFGELYDDLMKQNEPLLPFALYRKNGDTRYVYTSPPVDCVLKADDHVIVLSATTLQ